MISTLRQVLEDGRLTDGQGRTVSFRNTILIMTSNIGARLLIGSQGRRIGFSDVTDRPDNPLYGGREYEDAKALVMEEVKKLFAPEFINRIGGIIFFQMLDRMAMRQIVNIMLGQLAERIAALGIEVHFTDAVKDWLADRGYSAEYGARPLRRLIMTEVEDRFSAALLDSVIERSDQAVVDLRDDQPVVFKGGSQTAEDTLDEDALKQSMDDDR